SASAIPFGSPTGVGVPDLRLRPRVAAGRRERVTRGSRPALSPPDGGPSGTAPSRNQVSVAAVPRQTVLRLAASHRPTGDQTSLPVATVVFRAVRRSCRVRKS